MDDKDGLEDEWKDRCREVPRQYYNQTWIWMTRMDWKMNERIDVDAGDETTASEKKVSIFNLKRENDTI